MGSQNRVVRLNDRARQLRRGVDTELKLRLLAVVVGEALHEQRTETRAGTAAEGVEDKEALEAIAVVGQTADLVHDDVDLLLADGVVPTSVYGHARVSDAAERNKNCH